MNHQHVTIELNMTTPNRELKLETILPATIQEERHLWNHFLDLPAIPFRLKAGGIGIINPANIVRATVCPPVDGAAETALSADLLQSLRP
jgi:hypothetical protein